ncbi:MAG: zf-HC2 domain-containing protein [Phycisphaerae bacterium]
MDDWLDGALDPATGETIRTHLNTCPTCRDLFTAHGQLERDLQLLGRVADALPAHSAITQSPAWPAWRRIGRIAAVLVMMAGLTWTAIDFSESRRPDALVKHRTDAGVDPPLQVKPAGAVLVRSRRENQFVMPIPSESPRIQIVWIYNAKPLPGTPPGSATSAPASAL